MIISSVKIEDYEEIYSLWESTPGMGLNTIDDSKNGIEKFLNRNPTTCFIARVNNRAVGVVLTGHDGRRGYIYHLAVDVIERGKGIGKELVNRAIESLKAEGISKVGLVVFKKNNIGNEFWDKEGFETREDLVYRSKVITSLNMERIDT